MKKLVVLIIFSVLMSGTAQAQAWVKSKGKFYSKLGLNTITSDKVFDYNGDVVDSVRIPGTDSLLNVPKITENMLQFYGMYGLTDKFTMIGSIPVKSVKNLESGQSRTSLADLEFGAVLGAKTNGLRITPGFFVGIPTGYYDTSALLITGDGEWNFMPRLYFGNGSSKFYYTGFLGFNYRTEGRFHEIDGLIEGGYAWKKLYLILKMQFKESLTGGTDVVSVTGIYDNGQEFLSPNFGLYYKHTENLHFILNIGGAVYSRNAQAAPSINIGVAYEN